MAFDEVLAIGLDHVDLLGRVRMRVPEARESLDLGSLLPGCYIVEAENESGAHLQGKLIVAE